jgi:hypothetical protein
MEGSYQALTLAVAVFFCDRASQTAHGAVTSATRPSNATPERSALKTTPVIGAPRHDRARGRNPPGESLYDLDL